MLKLIPFPMGYCRYMEAIRCLLTKGNRSLREYKCLLLANVNDTHLFSVALSFNLLLMTL